MELIFWNKISTSGNVPLSQITLTSPLPPGEKRALKSISSDRSSLTPSPHWTSPFSSIFWKYWSPSIGSFLRSFQLTNIFPFELPPNSSPVDYVTLVQGGEGQTDSQLPSVDTIRKNVADLSNKDKLGLGSKEIPFRTPKVKQVIDLVNKKVKEGGSSTSDSTSTSNSSPSGDAGGYW